MSSSFPILIGYCTFCPLYRTIKLKESNPTQHTFVPTLFFCVGWVLQACSAAHNSLLFNFTYQNRRHGICFRLHPAISFTTWFISFKLCVPWLVVSPVSLILILTFWLGLIKLTSFLPVTHSHAIGSMSLKTNDHSPHLKVPIPRGCFVLICFRLTLVFRMSCGLPTQMQAPSCFKLFLFQGMTPCMELRFSFTWLITPAASHFSFSS